MAVGEVSLEEAFAAFILADAAEALGVSPAALMFCVRRPGEHLEMLRRIEAFDEMTGEGWKYDLLREVFVWGG